jgi:hypothetical protein
MSENPYAEITFIAAAVPGDGHVARAVGHAIFTQAESRRDLLRRIRDAVTCHFEPAQAPARIRVRFE